MLKTLIGVQRYHSSAQYKQTQMLRTCARLNALKWGNAMKPVPLVVSVVCGRVSYDTLMCVAPHVVRYE